MNFWRDAYKWGWATIEQLHFMVITDDFPWGDITKKEYEDITGQPYDPAEEPTPEPEQESEQEPEPPAEPETDPKPKK